MIRPDWLVTDIGIVAIDKSVGGVSIARSRDGLRNAEPAAE